MTIATVRLRWHVLAMLAVAAIAALPFDVTLAQFFRSDPLPGELRRLIHKAEFFGHGYGILGIAFTIYLLDETRRRQLGRLLFTSLMAGLACDVIKIFVHRVRPVDFSYATGQSTFLGLSFLHVDSLSQVFESQYHSFPSAHTATSVAFALALGSVYPKGGRWFLALATLVAIGRFDGGAHYVSDTLVGAMLGYVVACWTLGESRVGRWFSRFESASPVELWSDARGQWRPSFIPKQ